MAEDLVSTAGTVRAEVRAADRSVLRQSPEDIFEQCLLELVRAGDRVLDVGCGSGKSFRGDFAAQIPCRWIGIDMQPEILGNERLHSRVRGDAMRMPFADRSVD